MITDVTVFVLYSYLPRNFLPLKNYSLKPSGNAP